MVGVELVIFDYFCFIFSVLVFGMGDELCIFGWIGEFFDFE